MLQLKYLPVGCVTLPLLSGCGDNKLTNTREQSDGSTMTVGVGTDGKLSAEVEDDGKKKSGWFDFMSKSWPENAPSFAPEYPGASMSNIMNQRRAVPNLPKPRR
jgi:hypothetical protein